MEGVKQSTTAILSSKWIKQRTQASSAKQYMYSTVDMHAAQFIVVIKSIGNELFKPGLQILRRQITKYLFF